MIALATPRPWQLQMHRCRVLAQVIAGQVIQVARFNWQNTRDGCKYEQEDLGGGTNLHTSYTKQAHNCGPHIMGNEHRHYLKLGSPKDMATLR